MSAQSIADIEALLKTDIQSVELLPGGEIRVRDQAELLRYWRAEALRLERLINTPHTHDFLEAVKLEMPHQRERWGTEHDAGKTPADWVALCVYLLGKVVKSYFDRDAEKMKHHIITTAATLGNWFLAVTGENTRMRPGLPPS